jgi:hypothetical protein
MGPIVFVITSAPHATEVASKFDLSGSMRKHESCQHVRLKFREEVMEPRRFMRGGGVQRVGVKPRDQCG